MADPGTLAAEGREFADAADAEPDSDQGIIDLHEWALRNVDGLIEGCEAAVTLWSVLVEIVETTEDEATRRLAERALTATTIASR